MSTCSLFARAEQTGTTRKLRTHGRWAQVEGKASERGLGKKKKKKESIVVSVGFCRSRLYSNDVAGLVIWGSRWEQPHQS